MTTPSAAPHRLWPEQWAIHIAVEADRLEHRARAALGHQPAGQAASDDAVRHHVAVARAAAGRAGRWPYRGVRDHLNGTSVDRAYRNLHTAKVFAVDLLPDAEVEARSADVLARLTTVLDRKDPRRTHAERGLRSRDPAVRRATLKQAMEIAYDASDEEYARLRDFRNIVLLTAVAIGLFLVGLALVAAGNPQVVPLCFTPATDGTGTFCPSGHTGSAADVAIVAGLGGLGGGLAALLAIRNLRGTSTPYGLPVALAVLKVPSGALTAVAGLLLVGGGFAPGFSALDSQRQILAYALVFGYLQQVATRLVDNQAQAVLDKVPSKDPEGRQPDVGDTGPTAVPAQVAPVAPANGHRPENAVEKSLA